jgi:hypothetical protein
VATTVPGSRSAASSVFISSPPSLIHHHAFHARRKGIALLLLPQGLCEVAILSSLLCAGTPLEHRSGRLVTNLSSIYSRPPIPLLLPLIPKFCFEPQIHTVIDTILFRLNFLYH